jgi:predicted lipoprotein with Yx(FWY)xxD motif
MKTSSWAGAMGLALVSLSAHAQPVPRNGLLADASGRTVYVFDKDSLGKSNCAGACAAAWPAFVAKAGAIAKGDFGLIESNGVLQWAVKGKPLYYFAGDSQAGERNGDGSGGVWHVVIAETPVPAAAAPAIKY